MPSFTFKPQGYREALRELLELIIGWLVLKRVKDEGISFIIVFLKDTLEGEAIDRQIFGDTDVNFNLLPHRLRGSARLSYLAAAHSILKLFFSLPQLLSLRT